MLLLLLIIDIILLLAFILPVNYMRNKWSEWVDKKSPFLQPFTQQKRFGWRSWTARSFVIDARIDDIREDINALPEIDVETLMIDPAKQSSMSPMLNMLPDRKLPTGITVEWLDADTADIHARQYADWPSNPDDDAHLPLKQRQRLVEHLVIQLEPAQQWNKTKISYEMEVPFWVYIVSGSIILLLLAATWATLNYQLSDAFTTAALKQGYNMTLIIMNTSLLWIPLAWIATRVTKIFQLQSISLIDNVITTFGPMVRKD